MGVYLEHNLYTSTNNWIFIAMQEEWKRNKITIISGLLFLVLGCFITYSLANKSRDDYDLKLKVDAKVDKVDFQKHVEDNVIMYQSFTDKQDQQLTKINDALQVILQQSAENRTDISWIKRELKK